MQQVTLDGYLVRVRQRRHRNPQPLGDFDGQGSNLLSTVYSYLDNVKDSNITLDAQQKSAMFQELEKKSDSCSGRVRVGQFGYSSPIVDITNGRTAYEKTKINADMVPFFFEFFLPSESDKGILLAQRFGQSGIKQVIENTLISSFRLRYEGHMLDLSPLVPEVLVDRYLSTGRLKKLNLIKHSIPSDIADRIGGKSVEQPGQITLSIESQDPNLFPQGRIRRFFKGQAALSEIVEIEQFEPDNIKAIVDINGKDRTIDFKSPWRLKASFDVTEEIVEGGDGYPSLTSLKSASNDLIYSLAASAGIVA